MSDTLFTGPGTQWSCVSPLSSEKPGVPQEYRALARLSALTHNWDGYGSPPISQTTLEQAGRILAAHEAGDMPPPAVCPVSGGGVQIEWEYGGRELEIEVFPDGTIQYLIDGPDTGEGPLSANPTDRINAVRRLIAWLRGDPA